MTATRIVTSICALAWLANVGSAVFAATILLKDIDSGLTSPAGNYRWLDVADQAYSATYRNSYNYTKANVRVTFDSPANPPRGVLIATNLKPNFAYQLKLVGASGTPTNERIGLAGRWWQEEWNGSQWANGWNLNNKGTGYSPTPNDQDYFARRDLPNSTSPTGKQYRYTGYLVLDYFITDEKGNATVYFKANSSYHVLWKTSQRGREAKDGPLKTATFDPAPTQPAYSADFPPSTVSIFGEWERLPVGGVYLAPGTYNCQMVLTEESFHGSGGQYAGGWAAAMGNNISFVCPEVRPTLQEMSITNGAFSFAIIDCKIGVAYQVERALVLGSSNGWQSVFSFVSADPKTNWSELIPSAGPGAYYRVKSQSTP